MDVEKTVQFILESQAKHEVEIAEMRQQTRELQSAVIAVTGVMGNLMEAQKQTDARLRSLAEAQAEAQTRLTEAQAHTDDRLNALIDVVDKLIRRNGSGPAAS